MDEEDIGPEQPRSRRRVAVGAMAVVVVVAGLALYATGMMGKWLGGGAADGRAIYQSNCLVCHGEAGNRIPSVPLDNAEFLDLVGEEGLTRVVSEGKGTMPAWGKIRGGPLDSKQITAVVDYLETDRGLAMLSAQAGRKLYLDNCAECHGEQGNRIPAAALNSKEVTGQAGDAGLASTIRDGKGIMMAFGRAKGGPLSETEIGELVRFIRVLASRGGDLASTSGDAGSREARSLYERTCQSCHGPKGNRIPAAPLDSAEYLTKLGDTSLTRAIAEGKGSMPAYGRTRGGPLEDRQVATLVSFLKASAIAAGGGAGQVAAGAAANQGKDAYTKNCASCHGLGGDKLPQIPLNKQAYYNGKTDAALLKAVQDGKGAMPGFKATVNDSQARQIVSYLKTLAGAPAAPAPAAAAAGGPPGIPHPLEGREGQCLLCHGPDGMKPVPANHTGRTNDMCTACHKVKSGAAAAAPAAAGAGATAGAGAAVGGPPAIPHTLQGREGQCLGCHDPKRGLVKAPADHANRTNDMCTGCHQPGGAAGGAAAAGGPPAIPHPLQGREGQCLGCHDPKTGLRPAPDNHQGRTNDQCTGCHQPATGGAPAGGGAPAPATGGPPAIPHTLQGREGACLGCHDPTGGVVKAPADHANRTNDMCTGCHRPASAGGSASAGPPAIPHTLEGREGKCLACHSKEAKLVPVPDNHQGRTDQMCTGCHQVAKTGARTPDTFIAALAAPQSHAGRADNTCLNCHDGKS